MNTAVNLNMYDALLAFINSHPSGFYVLGSPEPTASKSPVVDVIELFLE